MDNRNRLATYSTMALSLIAGENEIKAQAIYFDIDPDTILESSLNEEFDIDINFDLTTDFLIANIKWTWYFSYWGGDLYQQLIEANPINILPSQNNSMAATTGFYEYFPYALEMTSLINEELNFRDDLQLLAYRKIPLDWSFYYLFYGGLWYPEKIDHYLGIRFLDADTCMHYGWIRCDVLDEGRKLIIKDYAYESRCNTGIAAGDTVGFIPQIILDSTIIIHPDEIISNELVGVSAYSFNGKVFIQLPDQNPTYHLKIISLKGDILYEKDLFNLVNEITVRLNNSIILIQLQCEGKFYTKKIFL